MSDLNRIEQNNAELRECIEIAESLPDAPETVGGWDIATMQKFVDSRGLLELYHYDTNGTSIVDADIAWLGGVDTSRITNIYSLFYAGKLLTTIPSFDVSNVTKASYMCYRCSGLLTVPEFNFVKATEVHYMFGGCSKLKEVTINIPSATSVTNMFANCSKMTKCHITNTNKVTSFEKTFYYCDELQDILPMNTSNSKTFYQTFYGCGKLATVPPLDMRSASGASGMFANCTNLTNLTLLNISVNLQVGNGTSWGHLLTVDSLVGLCYELRDTGSVKTLTIGSANLAKLASVYVRQIDITDAMRAEDDLIDEKLPFERCESTDEGATLIGDYILAKNWKLA